jgi:hypothetical protein
MDGLRGWWWWMIELRRHKISIELSLTIWTLSLELARIAGWTPAGTSKYEAREGKRTDTLHGVRHLMNWQTEYRASDGQEVAGTDAARLADCLTTASATGEQILQNWETANLPIPGIRTEAKSFNWFTSPEGKSHLRTLADFCRGGAFQIC